MLPLEKPIVVNESTIEIPPELLEDEHTREALGYIEKVLPIRKSSWRFMTNGKINMMTPSGAL